MANLANERGIRTIMSFFGPRGGRPRREGAAARRRS